MQEIPVSRGKNLSLTETQSGEKNPTKIKILFYLFLNFCWLYSNTWVQNALEHICHTGPGFSVEDCAAAGCWGYWESGLSSELETGKQTVTFIPCSKCHNESGINTGIPNFHNSLGVLYKCLCHDRQKLTGLTSVLLLTEQGAAAPGILRGVSTLPALQNGHGNHLNSAHFHCASMPTLGKKVLMHLCY